MAVPHGPCQIKPIGQIYTSFLIIEFLGLPRDRTFVVEVALLYRVLSVGLIPSTQYGNLVPSWRSLKTHVAAISSAILKLKIVACSSNRSMNEDIQRGKTRRAIWKRINELLKRLMSNPFSRYFFFFFSDFAVSQHMETLNHSFHSSRQLSGL